MSGSVNGYTKTKNQLKLCHITCWAIKIFFVKEGEGKDNTTAFWLRAEAERTTTHRNILKHACFRILEEINMIYISGRNAFFQISTR